MLLSACRKQILSEKVPFSGKVIIVGAGAAGLYAGYLLKTKGIDFEILEASATYGGRLGKLTGFADYPLDLGAQWLHGSNNILGDLIQRTQTRITQDDSTTKYWFRNTLTDALPDNINIFEGDDLPDISFKEYAIQKGLGADYNSIVENLAGDQGAAAERLSVYGNNADEINWSSGDEDYKFADTFYDLIDKHIAVHVQDHLRLNTIVTDIDYTQQTVTVTDSTGRQYTGGKVIVTVPITILKQGRIRFSPALPNEQTAAFARIGMDAGMKVFLKFTKRFYDKSIIGGSVCAAYADEHIGKTGKDHVLLAFVMGKQADFLNSLGNDEAITAALLAELDAMYNGQASACFVASVVANWTKHPHIQGGYSYSPVGMGNARKLAAQPVGNSVFFAGEAMNTNGHHQTVFGAVETGYREVQNILNGL
jgi:lysine-specific histone demethylase 1B